MWWTHNTAMSSTFLFIVGCLGVVIGKIGMSRGELVGLLPFRRDENPALFWYGILFQITLGAVCLIASIVMLFY
jgi:hypothetical protein